MMNVAAANGIDLYSRKRVESRTVQSTGIHRWNRSPRVEDAIPNIHGYPLLSANGVPSRLEAPATAATVAADFQTRVPSSAFPARPLREPRAATATRTRRPVSSSSSSSSSPTGVAGLAQKRSSTRRTGVGLTSPRADASRICQCDDELPDHRQRSMTVWERLRNPCGWRAGAKQISVDAMLPLLVVPILAVIAAQTVLCTVVVFLVTPVLVYYLHHNFLRFLLRTKFFLMWTITSVLMMMLVFEMSVVPLLEILPEENFLFMMCVVGGMCCGYRAKVNADDAVQDSIIGLQSLELGEGSGELCATCRRRAPPRAHHCRLCQTCILNREYHCKWLDCCIGSSNLRWYLGCLFFSAIAFIYGSNLTMTSVCHPFILIGTVLLPDNCSDVYHQLDLALCFVSALYSLLVGLVLFCYLVYHLWLLSLGTTSNERRLDTRSQYDHGILKNVSRLFCCKT